MFQTPAPLHTEAHVPVFSTFDHSAIAATKRSLDANPIRSLLSLVAQPDIISFAGGIPDPSFFPSAQLAALSATFLNDAPERVLQYGASAGDESLRTEIANYMASVGVDCTAENILITTGAQQAISILASVLCHDNKALSVQDVSYLGALQDFRSKDLDLRPLSLSQDANIAGAYVIPDFCNPTGALMSIDARHDLLERAERYGFALIEDAAYSELYFNGRHTPSLLSLDCALSGGINHTRTFFCGTMSKTLSPGLRVGWICGARDVIAMLTREKECCDIMTSPINQALVHACLRGGVVASQMDTLRAHYKQRRDAMCAALTQDIGGLAQWVEPDGGLFVWLTLRDGADADAILRTAVHEEKVAFVPGRNFQLDQSRANCLRLSFSNSTPDQIREGVSRLARVLKADLATA